MRESKWKNPFKIGRDGGREEVLRLFRNYIQNNRYLINCLPELRGRDLGCWCYPLPCHGQILIELLAFDMGSVSPLPNANQQTIPPPAPRKEPPNSVTAEVSAEVAVEVEMTKELFVKFSDHFRPFDVPNYPEVALAGLSYFQQEGLMCHPIRVGSDTVYKFVLPEQVPKVGHFLTFSSGGKDYKIPLYTWERKRSAPERGETDDDEDNDRPRGGHREEGTLLTFFRGAQGPLIGFAAEAFDRKIEECGFELIVPTKLQKVQKIRNASVFNGNRYCVIRTPRDTNQIPDSITITDPSTGKDFFVRVNYRGQSRFCSRCSKDHVGQCPSLADFYAARDKRRAMVDAQQIKTKIFSDSTLRSVDALGLRAEVCAMSGGGLGQVIQASLDDPSTPSYDNIIIMGGTNDAKQQNFTTHEAYAENVDRSLDKLKSAAMLDPTKNITLLKQVRLREEEHIRDKDELIRELYLARKITEVAKEVPNIKATTVRYETDPTGHPSENGTVQIINLLHSKNLSKDPLIWNPAYLVSENVYRGVESIFRYGCNLCDRYGEDCKRDRHANQLVCDECLDSFSATENPALVAIVERVNDEFVKNYNEDFPDNLNKRRREDDGEEFQSNEKNVQIERNSFDGNLMDQS